MTQIWRKLTQEVCRRFGEKSERQLFFSQTWKELATRLKRYSPFPGSRTPQTFSSRKDIFIQVEEKLKSILLLRGFNSLNFLAYVQAVLIFGSAALLDSNPS